VRDKGVRRVRAATTLAVLAAAMFGGLGAAGHDVAGASARAVGGAMTGGPGLPGGPAAGIPGGGAGLPGDPGAGVSGGGRGGPAGASGGGTAGGAGDGAVNIGPVQINAIRRPGLCWRANGNGAPITLESCDRGIQAQQWTLTSDGVLMNGTGYCLEARDGQPAGVPLYVDFARQCGGGRGQTWRFGGASGQLSSGSVCATAGGPLARGTEIVRRACAAASRGRTGHGHRGEPQDWSLGFSAVTLAAGTGSGPAGGSYTGYVTVANAASGQAAYGTVVRFGLPSGMTATGLRGTGGAAGLTCRASTLTCSGTLPAGASGRVGIAGRIPAAAIAGGDYTISARVSVTGTSQSPGQARTTASVTVAVLPAVASVGGGALTGRSPGPSPIVVLIAILAGVLVVGGGLLVGIARLSKALRGEDDGPRGGEPRERGRRRSAAAGPRGRRDGRDEVPAQPARGHQPPSHRATRAPRAPGRRRAGAGAPRP
jgi:hypothetical protein